MNIIIKTKLGNEIIIYKTEYGITVYKNGKIIFK